MKRFLAIFVCIVSANLIGIEPALVSKGAVVEGLFILQNKNLAVKKAIQDFKKELTECFGKFEKGAQVPSVEPQPYEVYHCKLRQLLYPTYIDELQVLSASLEKDTTLVNGTQPVSKPVFDGIMNKAFLAAEKVDNEKKLLSKIFEVDRQEHEIVLLQQARIVKAEGRKAITDLSATIREGKEEVARLRNRIATVNTELFTGDLKQGVFLDKLAFRRK